MERIDMNEMSQEEIGFMMEQSKLLFKFNHDDTTLKAESKEELKSLLMK